MTCPKCDFDQEGGYECHRCGVIFSKWQSASPRPSNPSSRPSQGRGPEPKPSGSLLNIAIAAGLFSIVGGIALAMNPSLIPSIGPADVQWLEGTEGLDEGLSALEEQGKPTFVFFYTTWCPSCKSVKSKLDDSSEFQACLRRGTSVKIDIDSTARGKDLFHELGFNSIPQMVVYRDPNDGADYLPYEGTMESFVDTCNELMTPI